MTALLIVLALLAIVVFGLMFWLLLNFAKRIDSLQLEVEERNREVFRARSDRRRMSDALVRSEETWQDMNRVLDHVIFEREAAYVSLNLVLEDQLTAGMVQNMRRLSGMKVPRGT
jgi:predicted Holliday junction resolvase-like endonuclease